MIKNKGLKFRKFYVFSIIVILIILVTLYSFQLYGSGTTEIINFNVSTLSLTVAIIALIISVNTYLSIDSVNDITKMEGNKLENENYITSISELVNMFNHKASDEISEELFNELDRRFKKRNSRTAIELADHLQYFIDVIIIFPALFDSKNKYHNENMVRIESILDKIETRKNELLAISRGNLLLIEETVKLIDAVITLQQFYHSKDSNKASKLLAIKGTVLKNSISKTIYYNYLALYYNKKATEIIQKQLGLQGQDVFKIDNLQKIFRQKQNVDLPSRESILTYLYEANRNIKIAKDNCLEDIMWTGFILYNEARIKFFIGVFANEKTEWLKILDEAIKTRNTINILIADIVGKATTENETTYVQRHFIYQEYLANLVKINIQMALKENIETKFGTYSYPKYEGLLQFQYITNSFEYEFSKIKDYQDEIRAKLKKAELMNV